MTRHISANGAIFHSPDFENGLVKLQDEDLDALSTAEELLMDKKIVLLVVNLHHPLNLRLWLILH